MRQKLDEIFGQRKIDLIHSAFVVHTLYQQQKLGKYCDLKVLVGDKQYFVHRCILAAASAQLDSQINGLDTIQLVGVTYYGFECLLEILYSGKLNDISSLSDAKFQQIVSAADALNAETVMEYCTRERGDLMAILLRRSSTVNVGSMASQPSQLEAAPGSQHQEAVSHPQDGSGVPVKAEVTELSANQQNFIDQHQQQHIVNEARAPAKDFEQDLSETPVAAEVEVDNTHSMQTEVDNPVGEPPKPEGHLTPNNMYQPVPVVYTESDAVNNREYHDEEEYESETSISCRVCGAVFLNSSDLKDHMHSHIGEKLFRCEICGLHFKFQSNLWKHKDSHKTEMTCYICGEEFKILKALQTHMKDEHPEQLSSDYHADGNNLKPQRFIKKRTGVTPSMERNKSAAESLISPVVVNDIMRGANGKYQCPLCERGFDRRWNLKCHVLIHTAAQKKGPGGSVGDYRYIEGGFSCPECGKPFRNLHNLRRHASTMHGMNAAQLAEASDPARVEYQARKPKVAPPRKVEPNQDNDFKFWCSICGRGFKRNRNLVGHMESHQGEGSGKYDCHVCGRRFAQKESLNGHLWVHGGKNEDGQPAEEVTWTEQ
uniref:ZF(C2H2)-41 zinc finger protein n=1 Tax=Phallusia mammillata TaxID=59560 RepID=A0A6F9DWY7_9ASCI|nr:ZF(C2H2)-41 zinc finger protein [Phallusia mammillata]